MRPLATALNSKSLSCDLFCCRRAACCSDYCSAPKTLTTTTLRAYLIDWQLDIVRSVSFHCKHDGQDCHRQRSRSALELRHRTRNSEVRGVAIAIAIGVAIERATNKRRKRNHPMQWSSGAIGRILSNAIAAADEASGVNSI